MGMFLGRGESPERGLRGPWKAVEQEDIHIHDRWIYLGQKGVGDTVLVPIP